VKDEVHCYEKIIEGLLRRINKSSIPEDSKKSLLDFYRECILRGYSKARIVKYMDTLERIARLMPTSFSKSTKDDIVNFITEIEQRDYSEWTKHDYKVILRGFYRWLKHTEYPEEVSWMCVKSAKAVKLPEELLTVDDINKLVDAADNLRDKAFIMTLYESGCRIAEILSLQIKHVQIDDYGAVLLVNGKTGQRRVRIIASAPKINSWLENHPLRNNPNAPLWVTIGVSSRNKLWTYNTAKDFLKKLASKAGIKKRVYAHLFRHSRATHLANHLTEAQMKQYFGWVQGSEIASVYVHLSGRDVDNALFRLNGIPVAEKEKILEFRPKVCPRCKVGNSPDAKFCLRCGMCLDESTAVQVDELRVKADMLMNELVKNPEVLNALLKGIDKMRDEHNDLSSNIEIVNGGNGSGDKKVQERKDGGLVEDNRRAFSRLWRSNTGDTRARQSLRRRS
jgi:integrase/recombinase XerD